MLAVVLGRARNSSARSADAGSIRLREHRRKANVRVMQINPSEVQTEFSSRRRDFNPRKLVGADIAQAIAAMLEMEDRAFVTEMSVWATNPTS